MAKQIGTIKLVGTIDDVTYYEMDGEHWARKKSSLTAKRFREDPCFEGSRRAAGRFGAGSALASAVYGQLPKRARKHGLQGRLTAIASRALRVGASESEVTALLMETLGLVPVVAGEGTTEVQRHEETQSRGQANDAENAEGVATKTPRREGAQSREAAGVSEPGIREMLGIGRKGVRIIVDEEPGIKKEEGRQGIMNKEQGMMEEEGKECSMFNAQYSRIKERSEKVEGRRGADLEMRVIDSCSLDVVSGGLTADNRRPADSAKGVWSWAMAGSNGGSVCYRLSSQGGPVHYQPGGFSASTFTDSRYTTYC